MTRDTGPILKVPCFGFLMVTFSTQEVSTSGGMLKALGTMIRDTTRNSFTFTVGR